MNKRCEKAGYLFLTVSRRSAKLINLILGPQQYQELFAICQALPGPASTKMLFCMALIHAGFIPAVLAFLLWR